MGDDRDPQAEPNDLVIVHLNHGDDIPDPLPSPLEGRRVRFQWPYPGGALEMYNGSVVGIGAAVKTYIRQMDGSPREVPPAPAEREG